MACTGTSAISASEIVKTPPRALRRVVREAGLKTAQPIDRCCFGNENNAFLMA
jgi:hypothetical protein